MRITLLRDGPEKTFAVLLDQGDEPVSALLQSARDHEITAAHLIACGGFQRVTLGHFEPSAKECKRIAIHEQVELLSFMGDIARDDQGQSQLHAKVVVEQVRRKHIWRPPLRSVGPTHDGNRRRGIALGITPASA
jgi:predicted DNA-binding protein with PD1-like motif